MSEDRRDLSNDLNRPVPTSLPADRRAALVERAAKAICRVYYSDDSRWRDFVEDASLVIGLALEEAAKVAEQTNTALLRDGSFFSERVAAAIRALKEKP